MTGFCSSPSFIKHQTGPHHPERPERIVAILQAVRKAGLVRSPNPFMDIKIDLGGLPTGRELVEIEPVTPDLSWIETVHSKAYIERVESMSRKGGVLDGSGDTPVQPGSYETGLLGIGALLTCCDQIVGGKVKRAFAAIRPPGHHAEPRTPMGFCLFANISIAARYLQKKHRVGKIAIVDFDVHHGNGTQAVFEADPTVLFISIHQDPRTSYPGTGYEWETGVGAGTGFTLNIPMPPASEDADYLAAFDEKVIPTLDAFKPEMILISAGFDAHKDDPLSMIRLTDQAFGAMTRKIVEAADRHCGGKILSVLEGGYNLGALGRSAVHHLIALDRE